MKIKNGGSIKAKHPRWKNKVQDKNNVHLKTSLARGLLCSGRRVLCHRGVVEDNIHPGCQVIL
jgi:hypothetical protein